MSIKQLRQRYNEQLVDASKKIEDYKDTVTSFSILEDPSFTKTESQTSISKLNESISNLTEELSVLNELWIIKGLIHEIEVFLDPDLFLSNLEVLFHHFENMQGKLKKLSDTLIIKFELTSKFQELVATLAERISEKFKSFLPSSDKLVGEVESMKISEFVEWINKFSVLDDKINLTDLIAEYKLIWESYILALNFKALSLEENELSIRDSDGSLKEVLESILSFIKFIDRLGISTLHRFYESKISNKLISLISGNINVLINDEEMKTKLLEIISASDWNLSIELTNNNFNAKLNEIYNNWLVDNYIDRIRKAIDSSKLSELSEIRWEVDKKRYDDIQDKIDVMEKKIDVMSDSKEATEGKDGWNDDWNDEWDNPEEAKRENEEAQPEDAAVSGEEADGWGDAWDDGWDDEPKKPQLQEPVDTRPSVSPAAVDRSATITPATTITTHIKISSIPHELIEIINDFQVDSMEDFEPLISTILALSTITYPNVSQSYLVYNDLQYLYKNIGGDNINAFTENLIKRSQNELSRKMFEILINIKVEEDNKMVFSQVDNWFKNVFDTQLVHTNSFKFKELIQYMIEFINNWLINLIMSIPEITELISDNLTKLIDQFDGIFKYNLTLLNEDVLESMNKLENIKFLVNAHLVDIIDRFYQGDLYNLSTEELVSLIKKCFIESDLREQYINEIIEFRNIA